MRSLSYYLNDRFPAGFLNLYLYIYIRNFLQKGKFFQTSPYYITPINQVKYKILFFTWVPFNFPPSPAPEF